MLMHICQAVEYWLQVTAALHSIGEGELADAEARRADKAVSTAFASQDGMPHHISFLHGCWSLLKLCTIVNICLRNSGLNICMSGQMWRVCMAGLA